jgi:hypothetical protein
MSQMSTLVCCKLSRAKQVDTNSLSVVSRMSTLVCCELSREKQVDKNSLSGKSRMSTHVCCEFSREKQVLARDARPRWDLIGANCECYYFGVVYTLPYSGR